MATLHDSDLSVTKYRQSLAEPSFLGREYASLDRLALRRLDSAAKGFDAESRLPLLQAYFASVSRLFRGGSVLWLTQRDLQRYLDAFVEMYGPLRAPDGPFPFTAMRRRCVFVADAP